MDDYDNPRFPIPSGVVDLMTLMGAPVVEIVAREMVRVLNPQSGVVMLFNCKPEEVTFIEEAISPNGGNQAADRRISPFNEIRLNAIGADDVRIYRLGRDMEDELR